jgi:hypothetical protein
MDDLEAVGVMFYVSGTQQIACPRRFASANLSGGNFVPSNLMPVD